MGFHLIAAHNGWVMAFTGAIIVMIGLAGLALIISQLHKVLNLFEAKHPLPADAACETSPMAIEVVDWMCDQEGAARVCQLFTAHMGDGFKLTELYKELERSDCPHPHLTVRSLREEGILIPSEPGLFCWKQRS